MKKNKNRVGLGIVSLCLFVNLFFFWNIAQDALFVLHMQETTGTIVRVEGKNHSWDTGRLCEFSYTVDGEHYRESFIYLCKEFSPECTLGNRIAVSYSEDAPENARQGSAARTIGIFVLKCSMYLFWNMIFIVGWVLHRTIGTKCYFYPRSL